MNSLLTQEPCHAAATSGTPAAHANHLRQRLTSAYTSTTAFRDRAQERQRQYYDHHLKFTRYKEGDLILVDDPAHQHNKLAPRWIGPYEVIQPLAPSDNSSPVLFLVCDLSRPTVKPKVIHYNRTKRFISDPSQPLQHITPFHRHSSPRANLLVFLPYPNLPATPTFSQRPHTYIHNTGLGPQHPQQTPTRFCPCGWALKNSQYPAPVHSPVGHVICLSFSGL